MSRRLSSCSMSLPDLLRSRAAFVLPATQRAYAWGESQINRLFEDAGYRFSRGSAHVEPPSWLFLGTIYLADLPDGTTAVADGQQRLVTGLMLHAGARDLEQDPVQRSLYAAVVESATSDGDTQPRLHLRDLDAAFFKRWVLDRGAMLRPFQNDVDEAEGDEPMAPAPLSESQTNILCNRSLIVEKLKAMSAEQRRRLLEVYETATELIIVTAPTVRGALDAFGSTLRRGLLQADVDRLKFEIIGDAPPDQRRLLANHWDETESRLGKSEFENLCALLIQTQAGKPAPADLLSGMMETFGLPTNAEGFILESLVPAAEAYGQMLTRGDKLGAFLNPGLTEGRRVKRIQGHVATLMRVSHAEWQAPALAALLDLRDNLVLLEETFQALERLACVLMIIGQDTHGLLLRYSALTAAIRSRQRGEILSAAEIDAELKLRARDLLASPKFAEKTRYRAPVLLKLNDLAHGEVTLHTASEVSCEHVLPQNVKRSATAWRQAFRSASGKLFNGHNYRHRLGNLTILTHAENRDCADHIYTIKRPILGRSVFALSRDLASRYDQWTPEVVEQRTQKLVQRLVKHWDLQ